MTAREVIAVALAVIAFLGAWLLLLAMGGWTVPS